MEKIDKINAGYQLQGCLVHGLGFILSVMLVAMVQITASSASEAPLLVDVDFRYQQIAPPFLNSVNLTFNTFLEAAGGYDSNANSASEVGGFYDVDLLSSDVSVASSYILLRAGTDLRAKINQRSSYGIVATFSQRENQNSRSVSYYSGYAQARWTYRYQYVQQILTGELSKTDARDKYQSYTGGLNFGLKFRLIYEADFHVNGSIRNNWFSGMLTTQKVVQTMLGVSVYKRLNNPHHFSMKMSVFTGENIPSLNRTNSGKNMHGGSIDLAQKWGERFPVLFSLNSRIMYANYDVSLYETERKDVLFDVNLMVTRRILKAWEIAIKLSVINNQSKIKRYNYLRVNSGLTLKVLL